MTTSTLSITHGASLWYPIMLAQEHGTISESKAAELLGMNIQDYREHKYAAIKAVEDFIEALPSGLISLANAVRHATRDCANDGT